MTTQQPTDSTEATSAAKRPIVLIHGLWMTPASWDTWAGRFRAQGYDVIVPGWPGIDDRSPDEVRAHPEALKGIGLTQIVNHYERIIRALPVEPIIMGHSFGGRIAQMLADRGLGAAVVGVAPAQPAGITTRLGPKATKFIPKPSVTSVAASQITAAYPWLRRIPRRPSLA